MNKSGNSFLIYILICGVCCGPISTGYILGYSSPTLRDLSGILSTVQKSTFASLLYIGGIIGSLIVAYAMDRYGRRKSIIFSAIPAIFGWFMIIFCDINTTNVKYYIYMLYSTRILGGISCGMNMACTTVYLIEISPTSWRGTIASLNQVGITIGIFLSYLFGKYFPFDKSAVFALAFSITFYLAGICIPESPRWLLNKNMSSDAKSSLKKLRSEDYDVDHEINELSSSSMLDTTKAPTQPISLMTMFQAKYRPKTLIVIQLMLLQQFSGINAFISYADIMFLSLIHMSQFIDYVPMIIGIVQIVFTVIATLLMDRYSRKSFLKVAGLMMAVSMLALSSALKVEVEAVIIASMALYIVGFSIGWGPIPVISSTEMLPQEARSSAGSIAVLTSWIGGYVVTGTFPILTVTIGNSWVFLMFGLICIYAVVFVTKKLPETKGLSLENVII